MRFPIGLSASLTAYILRQRLTHKRFIPLVLMLEPLFACNLKCTTCGRIREYRDYISKMMTLEDCIESARECGAPVVSICGGEPLLYPNIVELVNELVRMRRYVYLCTNGTLLTSIIERLTPSSHLILNVHIDGPPEVHDVVVSKNGAYESAANGIVLAAHLGFQISVNTTICKETDLNQVDALMDKLGQMGVGTFMLSPAYSYESVESKDCFMSRQDVHDKFRDIDDLASRHRLADTPVYLEYLKGDRDLQCTAWGNPTRNVVGWRSPCYLIADNHYDTYEELIERTDWSAFGRDKDPRCQDCMVHCGFEPSAALMINKQQGDIWKMLRWQFG